MPGSGSGGDAEPDRKRRRILDAGGTIEDDETARRKMRDAWVYNNDDEVVGFDPDDVKKTRQQFMRNDDYEMDEDEVSPMGYFAEQGDLPMMRWLYVNGADTRDVDVANYFPMFLAATRGRMEVCQWLFDRGAAQDVKRRSRNYNRSPLISAFGTLITSHQTMSRWLILKGALCKDGGTGDLDVGIMKQDLHPTLLCVKERNLLLEWANDLHRDRTSLLLFLSGACITRRSSSPARLLSGKSGVLELICKHAGIACGREAKIIRQLTELLPCLFG